MLSRFKGPDGQRRLLDALARQSLASGDTSIAKRLVEITTVVPYSDGDQLIEQSGVDNDLFLVLSGAVTIQVNGREVAKRSGGQHVGEMALIDPTAPRSASVFADGLAVVARISESDFAALAEDVPVLWRRLALELGNRLRQRGELVPSVNDQPIVFIGSSAEAREVAWEIRDGLSHEKMLAKAWTDDVFTASATTIETLEREVREADFAVMVVTADDIVESRGSLLPAPRDNVLWEHGLFTGALARSRTFIVRPRGVDLKMPSDLLSVTPLDYPPGASDLRARLGPTINSIRKRVVELGPK